MKKMQPTRWMPANGKEGKLERFISQNGSSEFEALLDQTEVDLFELNRPSVVERTFPSLIGITSPLKTLPGDREGVLCNRQISSSDELRSAPMGRASEKLIATISATLVAAMALLVSFFVFRWKFIRYWEWQHAGRRMIFVFGPGFNAATLAVLLSLCVFVIAFREAKHSGSHGDRR